MNRTLSSVAALIAVPLVLGTATPTFAQDAKAAIDIAMKALGSDAAVVQFSGTGKIYGVGQAHTAGGPWPEFNLKSFTRTMDYGAVALRDDYVRTYVTPGVHWGGTAAFGNEQRVILSVHSKHAWATVGPVNISRASDAAERRLQLWTSPHGVLKAAAANNATVEMSGNTKRLAFEKASEIRVEATLGADNLVRNVRAWTFNPVVGDMRVDIEYADWKTIGGVRYPGTIRQMHDGYPSLELAVTDVKTNVAVDLKAPEAVVNFQERIDAQQAAPGIWYVAGGSHHSVVIEMKDHVIVVEGPLNDGRASAVIAETKRLVPGKPIRYLVASHHHFDHSGGVRRFAAEGATIVAQETAAAFFQRAFDRRARFEPDQFARSGKKAKTLGVATKHVLTDGDRTVELHHIAGNFHTSGFLMAYLPKEKILIQADAFTPPAPNQNIAPAARAFAANLLDNVRRLNLDVQRLLPIHGRMVPFEDLVKAVTPTA